MYFFIFQLKIILFNLKMNKKDNFSYYMNILKEAKDTLKMDVVIENHQEPIRNRVFNDKQNEEIRRLKVKKLIAKILLIILLAALFPKFFISSKSQSNLAKETKKNQISPQNESKNKIITIGFYDIIHCDRKWRRIKKGYFYDLPKYTKKFRFVFLAKNGVDSNCNKFTHLTFKKANNYENLEKAVIENKIDLIVQNEDESLEQKNYLLKLKKKFSIKLVQIMHEYYFYFLVRTGSINNYNIRWKPLKKFDAIISSVPCQIYMYHLQSLNQSIYLPQYLPFDYRNIEPSKLETKNILMIGRISGEKQYELGIKAMPIIIKKFPDAILKIIGGFNSYTRSLKQLTQNLNVSNNVIFYDLQQDLRPFYSNASLYFMTSIAESFSFVLAESKAYGLANIVTGKEYLVLTKKGSIVVKDNDYEEMANEAIKLFSNVTYLREQGKIARESLDDFLAEKVNLRYINLFESLMNGTSKNFIKQEYEKYINEKENLKYLLNSLELAKTIQRNKFHCLKFEDFLKPFETIHLSYCNKK